MSQNHQNLESVVERIVHEHFALEENLEKVIWIRSRSAAEICLLEVNSDTFATGMVQSFYFPPSDEIPYPLILAEVTPEEWQKILRNEIELPEGWSLENHKAFVREVVAA